MISEHGQTGSALAVHVKGVDGHDDRVWPGIVRHQDTDPAAAEADRVVRHPKEKNTFSNLCCEVRGQGSGALVSPGASVLIQVDPARRTDGLRLDSNRHRVKGHFSLILLHPGAEGRGQSEGRVSVDLSEVGVHTGT